MRFEKGNKAAKGGKRNPPGGRPTKEQQEIKKAASEIARDYIERSVKPVMHTYFQLAHGRLVNKWHDGQVCGQEFEADAATTRHCVDKLLPDEEKESAQPIQITFLRFGNNPSQLPAEELAALTSYDPRRSRLPLPAPIAEEKTEIEYPQVTFHDFVRKRRE